jgi:predicted RNA methylase
MQVLEVLKQSNINGNVVTLPDVQLDRKTYQDIAKKLELIGGKWNKSKKGFLFQEDPTNLFTDILNGDTRNIKKEFQFFETPKELADEICSYIPDWVDDVLEPSAGRGALVRAINKAKPNLKVYYCELMELNRKQFKGNAEYLKDDFMTLHEDLEESEKFDCIVANPPFNKNQDIDHFMQMFKFCRQGGLIISIMSKHWQLSENKKETEFKEFLNQHNAEIIDIEAGKFKSSGTNIATCLIVLHN